MKLSEKKQSGTHTVLLFGPPKSGKTQLAGSLAHHFNIIYFDLENGWSTLSKLPQELQDKIEIVSLPDTQTFPIAIETMMKVLTGRPYNICDEHGKIDCALCKKASKGFTRVCLDEVGSDTIVIFDSASQLSASVTAHLMLDKSVDYKFEFDDWRKQGAMLHYCFSHMQQAKYNLICITHETEVEMEDGKKKLVPTAGTGNFSRNTAKYFGHVVYVEVKNKRHIAASSSTYATNLLTGSRTGAILESGEANLLKIFKPEILGEESVTDANKKTPGAIAGGNLASKLAQLRANK